MHCMNRGSLLRDRGISIHEGLDYHEPVTPGDMRLYKTSNNFVVKSYEGHPINRGNFLIIHEFIPVRHRKYNH